MGSVYQENERKKYIKLIENDPDIFDGSEGGGLFKGNNHPFVLKENLTNLYKDIRADVLKYFSENDITWWAGTEPSGHVLSSQISCLNHLFLIKNIKTAVLKILNGIKDEFVDVLPITSDKTEPGYIAFEVVSTRDHLNELISTRGSNCTSIDALCLARHKNRKIWLIAIEWKYTEFYPKDDKSAGEAGKVRLERYSKLIDDSKYLKSLKNYQGSIYYQEPFFQLMRQTLWAEQVILHSAEEELKADDFLHIHVIPEKNYDLLQKENKISGKPMEETWRECLQSPDKYIIIDPHKLMEPLTNDYSDLCEYLAKRYWA